MTTYTVVTLTDAGAITTEAGQTEAEALTALRAYHASVDQIMAGAASEATPGVWFFLESRPPLTLAARQSRLKAAQPAPVLERAAPVIAPPGAKFMRRVAELDKSPGRALAGKTAREIEHIIDAMGDRISPSSLTTVLKMHTTAVELEAQAEADAAAAAAAANATTEDPVSQPGAKILRRQAAEEKARLEAEEADRLEAAAAADPERQLIAKLNASTSLTEIAEHVDQLPTDRLRELAGADAMDMQAGARLVALADARDAIGRAYREGAGADIRTVVADLPAPPRAKKAAKPKPDAKAKKTAVETKVAPGAHGGEDGAEGTQDAKKA
jgi:hypothetical protein